jgi:hypothetical protein
MAVAVVAHGHQAALGQLAARVEEPVAQDNPDQLPINQQVLHWGELVTEIQAAVLLRGAIRLVL